MPWAAARQTSCRCMTSNTVRAPQPFWKQSPALKTWRTCLCPLTPPSPQTRRLAASFWLTHRPRGSCCQRATPRGAISVGHIAGCAFRARARRPRFLREFTLDRVIWTCHSSCPALYRTPPPPPTAWMSGRMLTETANPTCAESLWNLAVKPPPAETALTGRRKTRRQIETPKWQTWCLYLVWSQQLRMWTQMTKQMIKFPKSSAAHSKTNLFFPHYVSSWCNLSCCHQIASKFHNNYSFSGIWAYRLCRNM